MHFQSLILVLLLTAVVRTRRVIRAAPGIETTGQYMVVLTPETSDEQFETIAKKIQSESLSSEMYKMESPFVKIIVAKLSIDEAHKVSFIKDYDLYIICMCVCIMFCR